MKAKLFTLHIRDILKGFILAIITAVVTLLINELTAGSNFDIILLKKLGMAALIAFLSYLLKNFLTNSKDEFITPEK